MVVNENLTDSKIFLRQRVTYDSPENYNDDVYVDDDSDLYEEFETNLEEVIEDVLKNKDDLLDKEEAELIKDIELLELSDYVEISIQLSKQLSKSQVSAYFKDMIEYLVGEMDSQPLTVRYTNNTSMHWDYSREEPYEKDEDDYEDEEYVSLKTVGEVQITYDKFIKEESISTDDFFNEFEYESEYDQFLGRGIAEYLYDRYSGKDLKSFDAYVKEGLKENTFSLDDLRSWDRNFIDMIVQEARNESKQLKESIINDYAKLKTQLNKEKQFNKKIEINNKLNKLIKDNNLEFKDQSSGNDNYKYQLVLSNGKEIGTIQLGSSGKVSVYESKQLKEDYSEDQKKYYKEMFNQCCEESTIGHKKITIDVYDTENNCIEALLRYIQKVASQGHSFPIFIDNEGDWSYARFGFDGDGSDRIIDIQVEEIKEEGEE